MSDKKLLSTGAQHRITLMHVSNSRNGGPRPHPPDVCTQQPSSASLSLISSSHFPKQGRFSAVLFPKEHSGRQPGMQSQQKGAALPSKGPIVTQHPLPLFLIPGKPRSLFPGVLGHPLCQPTPTKDLISAACSTQIHCEQGQFLFAFLLFISKEKSILFITGLLFC